MKTCCFVLILFLTFLYFSNFYTEATQRIHFHEVAVEKCSVTLRCALSVGAAVKWSRDSNGSRVDVLTVAGDNLIKHVPDPQKNYNKQVDGALFILKVKTSDSGMYYCNDTAAVNLTVVSENTKVTLRCPESVGDTVGWRRRDSEERDEDIFPTSRDTDRPISDARRPSFSLEDNSLVIMNVDAPNSGTYYCYGDPDMTSGKTNSMTTSPSSTITTQTKGKNKGKSETTKKPNPARTTVEATTTTTTTTTTTGIKTTSTTPEPSKEPITEPTSTTEPRKPATPLSTTKRPKEPLTTKEPAIPKTTTRTAESTTPVQFPGGLLLTVWKVAVCVLSGGLLIVMVLYLRRRFLKTQEVKGPPCGDKQLEHIYTEISDEAMGLTTLGAGKSSQREPTIYYLADCPDESNHPDHTYSMIPDPSHLQEKTVPPPQTDAIYSLIESFQTPEMKTDTATSNYSTYSLID